MLHDRIKLPPSQANRASLYSAERYPTSSARATTTPTPRPPWLADAAPPCPVGGAPGRAPAPPSTYRAATNTPPNEPIIRASYTRLHNSPTAQGATRNPRATPHPRTPPAIDPSSPHLPPFTPPPPLLRPNHHPPPDCLGEFYRHRRGPPPPPSQNTPKPPQYPPLTAPLTYSANAVHSAFTGSPTAHTRAPPPPARCGRRLQAAVTQSFFPGRFFPGLCLAMAPCRFSRWTLRNSSSAHRLRPYDGYLTS